MYNGLFHLGVLKSILKFELTYLLTRYFDLELFSISSRYPAWILAVIS